MGFPPGSSIPSLLQLGAEFSVTACLDIFGSAVPSQLPGGAPQVGQIRHHVQTVCHIVRTSKFTIEGCYVARVSVYVVPVSTLPRLGAK